MTSCVNKLQSLSFDVLGMWRLSSWGDSLKNTKLRNPNMQATTPFLYVNDHKFLLDDTSMHADFHFSFNKKQPAQYRVAVSF